MANQQKYFWDDCFSERYGINGTCVSVRHCLSVIRDIKRKTNPELCSFKGLEPIVCCTDCELVNDTSQFMVGDYGNHFKKTGRKSSDKCLEYLMKSDPFSLIETGEYRRLSPEKNNTCYNYYKFWSLPNSKRIRRSEPENKTETDPYSFLRRGASLGRFPHMALLGYGETPKTAQWVCGGSVISHRFILTAAHCISTSKSDPVKYIALGILKRSELSEYQLFTVKQIIPHPEYKSPSKYHDIALLETNEWIKFSREVSPICLYDGSAPRLKTSEDVALASGFGAIGPKMALANNLQYIKVTKFSDEECDAAYPPYRNLAKGFDPNTQLCYGDKNGTSDSCEGDSGGPLFVSTISLHEQRLIGVVSTGRQCGTVGNPGIYTRVEHYLPWIENIVWPF